MGISYNTTVVRNGLVLHLDAANPKSYPGSGTVWTDLSGNGNNGTLVNGVAYSSSDPKCFTFDKTNDYVTGSITPFSAGAAFSSVTWFKVTNNVSEQHLTNLAPTVQFYVKSGQLNTASYGALSGGIVANNTWYMAVQTRSADGSAAIYLNANQVALGTLPSYSASSSYVIGNYVGGGNYWFGGNISVSQIYNRVLSATEVKQNFEALRGRYSI